MKSKKKNIQEKSLEPSQAVSFQKCKINFDEGFLTMARLLGHWWTKSWRLVDETLENGE